MEFNRFGRTFDIWLVILSIQWKKIFGRLSVYFDIAQANFFL